MAHRDEQIQRPYPPRTSSRFAPGVYFNFEWGVSLAPERPTHVRGINFTSRRMQEKFYKDEQDRSNHFQHSNTQAENTRYPPRSRDQSADHDVDPDTRDYQQERQRRLGVRPLEQHQRGSSAPPSFDRDDIVSPLSEEGTIRPIIQTSSFPRERLDRPLPYSPARFRLGEDDLPWSVPPWYRSPEPEFASPIVPRAPSSFQLQQGQSPSPRGSPSRRASIHSSSKTSISSSSRASVIGPLPSLGFESTSRRDPRHSPRRRESSIARPDDSQRAHDLGAFHSAMMGVEGLHNEGWESWAWQDSSNSSSVVGERAQPGPRSLGWAVRTEPVTTDVQNAGQNAGSRVTQERVGSPYSYGSDFVGFYGPGLAGDRNSEILMSPPPAYVDSQWEEMGRRLAMRPRTSYG